MSCAKHISLPYCIGLLTNSKVQLGKVTLHSAMLSVM